MPSIAGSSVRVSAMVIGGSVSVCVSGSYIATWWNMMQFTSHVIPCHNYLFLCISIKVNIKVKVVVR